jgi:hypothetical protein
MESGGRDCSVRLFSSVFCGRAFFVRTSVVELGQRRGQNGLDMLMG